MIRDSVPRRTLLRVCLITLAMTVMVWGFSFALGGPAFGAAKPKLTKTKISMKTGKTAKLRVKNVHQKVKWTTSDKKIVSVRKASGKYRQSVVLKAGKKTGKCRITAKIGKKKLKCVVIVRKASGRTDPTDPVLPTDPTDPSIDPVLPTDPTMPTDPTEPVVLSPDSVDLAAELPFSGAEDTAVSEGFPGAWADFSLRLLKATLTEVREHAAKTSDGAGGATDGSGNLLISPDSVLTALTMTENGAAGSTLKEMHQTLLGGATDAGLSLADVNADLWRFHTRLTSDKRLIYSTANSIWARKGPEGIRVNPAFLQTNKTYHNAAFYEAAFDDQTVSDMNNWVFAKTREMIRQIINPETGLSPDARMVLINTVAFEGNWAVPFIDNQIDPAGKFTRANGTTQTVTMLTSKEDSYLELAGGTGFAKYYNGGNVAFVGLLPPAGTDAADYAMTLTGKDFLKAWDASRKSSQEVIIRLPEFAYDYGLSMKPVLQRLGMRQAFIDDVADFSAM